MINLAKKIADEIIEQIPILYDKLKNKNAVARELNISPSTVTKYLKVLSVTSSVQELNKKEKKTRIKITPELIEKINEDYKLYKSQAEVARRNGISASTVKKYLSEENKKIVEQQQNDKEALWYYIYRLFGHYSEENPVNPWNITQINKFHSQGYTYRGQLLTLKYFFEIQRSSIEKANNSIGIIPYKYAEAAEYFAKKQSEQQKLNESIQKQLEKDRVEIKYIPYKKNKENKKNKKIIDLNSL